MRACGRPVRLVGTVRDVTARRKADEQRILLIHELNHRVKNTLAVVQSIASQTLRRTDVDPDARKSFEARLLAMAKAHDILTQEHWSGADLSSLVEGIIHPFITDAERFRSSGTPIRLVPNESLTMALVFHELATNAVKYGAWSTPSGRVDVTWLATVGSKATSLRLTWQESGGPVVVPPTRSGFGSRLLDQAVSLEFGKSAEVTFDPGGLRCVLTAELGNAGDV
jgi:two-component sensor histidine kinase